MHTHTHTHINRLTMPLPFLACGLPCLVAGFSPWSLSLLCCCCCCCCLRVSTHKRTHAHTHARTHTRRQADAESAHTSHSCRQHFHELCAASNVWRNVSCTVSLAQNLYTLYACQISMGGLTGAYFIGGV